MSIRGFADLTPEQLARLHVRLRKMHGQEPLPAAIPRRTGTGPAPLSFAQQRIWLQHQLDPAAAAFNVSLAVRLRGALDRAALGRALDEVVRRHEVLRTRFRLGDDGPEQVVLPAAGVEVRALDVSAAADPMEEALRLAGAEAIVPFDLERDALLRVLLVRSGAEEHVLLLVLHHVVTDRWSYGILLGEVVALYRAFAEGRPSPLPDLPVQYADFALWQREQMRGEVLREQVEFWRKHLEGAPAALDLPVDHLRGGAFHAASHPLALPAEASRALREAATAEGATPYMVLLAAYAVLLRALTGQDDLVVGTLVASRTHKETEALVGSFANTLAIRLRPSSAGSFRDFLGEVRETMLEAHRHQDLPFERLVEELRPARQPGRTPLFQTALNLQKAPPPPVEGTGLAVEVLPVQSGAASLDLYLSLEEKEEGIVGALEYDASLFTPETAALLAGAYVELLSAVAADPELAAWKLPAPLRERAEAARARAHRPTLAVSATFTAEPVEAPLRFWSEALDLPFRVEFAPYAQVFQQLLDPGSLLSRNRDGADVVLARLEDWARDAASPLARVERAARELAECLRAAAGRVRVPILVVVCPSSPAALADPEAAAAYRRIEAELAEAVAGVPGLHFTGTEELLAAAPGDYHDPGADEIGHIPFTDPFFAALGTLVARRVHALRRPPAKVVVLDCDGVLWRGVLGEDGVGGVVVDPARRALQERVVEAQRAGALVCLCTRNREEDVLEALRRPDMVLRREHVVDWRINWLPKSENLRSLAESLDLGLDSFLFVDDDPVVCAEVRAGCPEALVLRLPEDPAEIRAFAGSLWPLDRLRVTAEDRERTGQYRLNAERARVRRDAPTLEAFLADLELRVDAAPAAPEQYARLAQLTQRTNQFNASTRRRDEAEVRAWAEDPARGCLAVEVSDRFGAYGLVGMVLHERRRDALEVDTLLLSCRVLGRGVEHRVVAELGRIAREAGCAAVEIPFVPTARNEPVRDFLDAVARRVEDARGARYVLSAAEAGACRPSAARPDDGETVEGEAAPTAAPPAPAGPTPWECYQRIATELADPDRLLRAVRASRAASRLPGEAGPYVAPRTPAEEALAVVFAEVLGVERMGVEDDFFALGGHSVLATRVLSRVRQAFGAELPLRALFEAPTVAALARRVEALLAGGGGTQAPPLVALPRDGSPLPLSFAQQRLWFIDQLEPGSPAYNMPFALRLRGSFDPAVLERAVTEIVRRHETLRTVFATVDGEPVQVVRDAAPVALPVADLRALSAESREVEVRRLASGEAVRPFDLAAGPLLRVSALRLDDAEWAVLLTMHHIVSDGWSMGVLIREVSALYDALSEGRDPALPALAVQYADYAAWQRGWLTGETLEAKLGYWRDRLSDAPPLLELPTDRLRPQVQDARGASVGFRLPADVSAALRALSRREGATAFMTLLAAWQLLLARYSGQEDVSVGTPIAGRTRLETEPLIGFFVNTLVLRTDLSGEPTFRELLGRVRETTLGAYQHQEIPFERLVEDLAPERSLAHSPLFQVMFVLQNNERGELRMGELKMEPLAADGDDKIAKFDLTLDLAEDEQGFAGSLSYRAELWDGATMERMAVHFARLVETVVGDAARPVADVAFLGAEEREQLLVEWNDTDAGYPAGALLHGLFAAQAARTPDAAALVFGGEAMTYGELDAAANRLAHLLVRRGVGPESRVGVFLERRPELLVAMLGVLKAGGAYVPLDPAYPAGRLGYMIEDARVELVLTTTPLADRVPGAEALALDAAAGELAAEPATAPETEVGPENLSHVIFTSGSTGRPNGVMIRHSSTAVLMHWMRDNVTDEERSGVLWSTSVNFDVSVAEIFGTLCWGGRLVLVENALSLPEVAGQGIVYASMVPTAAAELLRMRALPASLKRLNLGGEALPGWLAQGLYATGTVEKVGNLYGPTEDTTYSTSSLVEKGSAQVLIGRPVADTRAYVLDGRLQPVPAGVAGELYLAGAGTARGYAGRPELTAGRFVPDPFGEPGSRIYRVMDRVRWRAEGELEYFGRTDFQVKVRGFRIEPGEIETALERHERVRRAVAMVREDAAGDRRIVAYVVPADGEVAPAELRAHLRAYVPEYMLPAAFVALKELPLTGSGKVDRRALPAPESTGRTRVYVPPRTPGEEMLAGIWGDVLGTGRVGAEDDFFELGGHSLLVARVVSRVREAFGVELPLRALFEAPTVGGLAARIELLQADGGGTQAPPLVALPRDGSPLPLSFAQQRLWFIDQLEPGSAAYNMPYTLRLRGRFDPAVLERSLTEIVRRHETLRTVFATVDGEPVQVVREPAPVALPVTDLRSLPAEPREEEVRRLAWEEAVRPFDLAAGPLLRVSAVRLDEAEWGVLFTLHHIVSDGWSIGVLIREVSALYDAVADGREAELPALPVQYADFAAWQRGWLAGETLEAKLGYWRDRLADAPPLLELPTDRPRSQVQGARGAIVPFHLPADVSAGLRALSRREGATAFMTLLAAWQLLLARYSGQEDVVVGTPIAGRTRLETEPLIGFFVNTLVLRTDLSGEPTFRELLGRVRETTLGAYQHQEIPFERVVEELAPERSLAHSPLFQVMFVLQNNQRGGLRMGALEMEPLAGSEEVIAKFDLTLGLAEDEQGVEGSISYRAGLWERATMERMAEHFARLVEAVVAEPARPVSGVAFLGEEERAQVLEEWNATAADFPRATLHELFAAQVERSPHAPALTFERNTLTYAELDARAGRLALRLRALGAGPETRVAVCLERSVAMVVALLGTLRAGAAYVPVDPEYPAERIAYMLEDARAAVLLADEARLAALPPHGARVLRVDDQGEAYGAEADGSEEAGAPEGVRAAEGEVWPESLAYVIYTSGSTGRPKGAMNAHSGIVNRLLWMQAEYGLTQSDVVLQKTPFSFDVSVWEFFWPLLNGARLVLARPEGHRDPAYLSELIEREGVTTLHFVPPMLQAFLEAGEPGRCDSLRRVVCSGEALPYELTERFFAALPGVGLHNLYGPTEAAVDVTYWACEPRERRVVPIGRPVANTGVYVLDAALNPVPVGVGGELFIAGVQVGRGYLGRPELTAERFVPDALSGEAGARLYCTGDRVRWSTAGEVEYLGRMDFQVKVRGFRIELGEIEAALLEAPGVREAVVLAREDRPGERRLVGYVVAPGADTAGLRERLWGRLPEYMVPAAVVVMEALPLTPSGKLDRRALPAPERAPEGEYVAPRTATEEVLSGIWAEVLELERVGVEENFFGLGGHSLLATRVVSRMRQAFGVEVPLRALFEAPTAAALGVRVEELRGAGLSALPPVVPVERTGPLPTSFAQERLWFIDQLQPGGTFYNIPVALRLQGELDPAALERALGEVVRRHEALRTLFAERAGAPVQVVDPFTGFALPVEDLSATGAREREAETRRLVAAEASHPFDLAAGPLFRAKLLRLGAVEHVLLLCMHHIVSDGWSMDVLLRELAGLYAAYREGRESPLPELEVQYADYAVWQREQLRGEALERQVAWWMERLSGAPELLELPTDRSRPAVMSFRGALEPVRLRVELVRRLEALGRSEGATLFMVVLGAFQVLLSRYSGNTDVVVGSTIAGRTRREVEGLVGLFMNTLVFRTQLGGDPAFRETLRRVREVTLGAYDHQEVPFERLVSELRPERSLGHTPVFQVLFELHNTGGPGAVSLPGLVVDGLDTQVEAAKFDLTVSLRATPDGIVGELSYSTDLFEAGTARRMVEHLERVLAQVAADPDTRISELGLLGEAERRLVVEEWNRTVAEFPADLCIHQLFQEQARRTPDAVAVVFAGESLTFRELDERADRLAHHLFRRGVGPEVRVGLCLERSLEVMVAILGVLKAGGAYVPVDPAHPAERIAYVLEDSDVSLLLTQGRLRDRLPVRDGIEVVCLDAEWERIAAGPAGAPESGVAAENLCYVIYTSGSTGRPKGVAMHHRGVCNYIDWGIRFYGADRGNGAPVFSSMAVDLTITNLLPLFAGKPVRLLPEENPVETLAEVLRERPGFGLIKITPTHLSLLAPLITPEEARAAARTLVVGADFLAAETTLFMQEHAPEVRLMNEYGPTETVVGCSAYLLPSGVHRAGAVPVGSPIQNLRFFVLDAALNPVPVGLPGELFIGGVGVARGYLGRPALSAEKFVPDPFAGAGARMYRTGDRARWLEGGNLLILGRADNQVKVRGYRVELGEIEAALRRHDAVSGCVVVLREDAPGDRRLVAYVVPEAGEVDTSGLREHLRRIVPEYMVPSAFVRLDSLPNTTTGKFDPRSLPAPEYGVAERYVAPRTPVEEALAEIWAGVLGLERVGTEESFFDLGGDSILALQVVSRARWGGVEITPRQMLEHHTISRLAEVAGRRGGADAPAVEQGRPRGAVPPTPIQAAFFARGHAVPWHHNLSVLLEVDPAVPDAALEAAVYAVLGHHDALRLRFRQTEAGWEQWYGEEAGIELERIDLSSLPREERERAQAEITGLRQESLDLEHGPLGRAVLFDRGEEGRVLFLVLHHLVVDGVSWRLIREDLDRACAQAEAGGPIDLGPRSASFQEWAASLVAYAAGGAAREQAGYWLAQGPEGIPPLPVDGEGEQTIGSARGVAVHLGAEETRALLQEVPAVYGTRINDVLLCALADAVGEWAGSSRTRVALEGHGRAEEVGPGLDLTRSVGWFTSIYPVVLDTAGVVGIGERLSRVKEQLLAVPAQGVGYGVLRYLSPDEEVRRALAAQPEPGILFNYLGQFDQGLAPGLRVRFTGGPRGADVADSNHSPHPLYVGASIVDGRLHVHWRYDQGIYRRETAERLAGRYLEALQRLIAHCREVGPACSTPESRRQS